MNILYIANSDPREARIGMEIRTNRLWTALKDCGEVFAVGYNASEHEVCVSERLVLAPLSPVRFLPARFVNGVWSVCCNLMRFQWVMRCWPFARPLDVGRFFPGITFDVVVVRYMTSAALFHAWRFGSKLIVDMDDDPVEVFDTVARPQMFRWWGAFSSWVYGKCLAALKRRTDAFWYAKAEQAVLAGERSSYLPNLAPEVRPQYVRATESDDFLLTVSTLDYAPNRTGVERFLVEVWPQIRARCPDLTYRIAGKGLPEDERQHWAKIDGVELLGYVADLDPLYATTLSVVAPVDSGGGTSIKVIDALAHGVVCLTSAFGARGHSAACEQGLVTCTSAEEYVSAICDLRTNAEKRRLREAAALRYIADHFSRDAFARVVGKSLKALDNGGKFGDVLKSTPLT